MNNSKIICGDLTEFVKVCSDLFKEGITFEAFSDTLKINLQGY